MDDFNTTSLHESKNEWGVRIITILCPLIIDLTQPDIDGCVEILRTGQKKGQQCNCKIEKDQLCKRHYNLKHHKVPIENKEL